MIHTGAAAVRCLRFPFTLQTRIGRILSNGPQQCPGRVEAARENAVVYGRATSCQSHRGSTPFHSLRTLAHRRKFGGKPMNYMTKHIETVRVHNTWSPPRLPPL